MFFAFSACKNNEIDFSKPDYIIFGHYYGECYGEQCIEIYKLQPDKLLEDSTDQYPNINSFYEGKYVEQSQQKFNTTKDLTNSFPTDLLKETKTVIGQPDAGDWGGLYIEYKLNGIRKYWLIDQMKSNVPEKYHNFINKVNEKIGQLH